MGFAEVLELTAELDGVAIGEFHLFAHFRLSPLHPAFHVAVFEVHHQGGPPLA